MLTLSMKTIRVVDNVKTGIKAKTIRTLKGLTYREVALEMECSIIFLYYLEKGKRQWCEKWVSLFNDAIQKLEEKR